MGENESSLRGSPQETTEAGLENKAVDIDITAEQCDKKEVQPEKSRSRKVTQLLQNDSWTGKPNDLDKEIKSPALNAATKDVFLVRKFADMRGILSRTFFAKESEYVFVQFPKQPEDRPADMGFTLHGGLDNPLYPGDPGIFVNHVIPGSAVDGKLRPGDRVLSVNGLNVTKVPIKYAREAAIKAKGELRLYIKKASKRQQRINDCIRRENEQETPVFNNQQIEEIEDAFSVFDKTGSGKIKVADVFPLIRSLGHNPMEAEVWVYMNELGLSINRKLKLAEFLRLMAALTKDEDHEEHSVLDSIRVFDTEENGFISTAELREALQCMPGSSQMRDFELKGILRRADPDGHGKIKIKDFEKLLEPSITRS